MPIIIEGRIKGWEEKTVFLQEYEGYLSPNVDTAVTDEAGRFSFSYFPRYQGLHRLLIDKGNTVDEQVYVDLILSDQRIKLHGEYPDVSNTLEIAEGRESKALRDFLGKNNELTYREVILQELVSQYPVSNRFIQQSRRELQAVREERQALIKKFISDKTDNPLASAYVELWKNFEQANSNKRGRQDFWKGVDFSSPLLLRTNVVSQKVLEYFKLYESGASTFEEIKSFVDLTLDPQEVNPLLWDNSFKFLELGFTQMGATEMLQYLKDKLEQYQSCDNPSLESEIDRSISLSQGLDYGHEAPDFQLLNEKNTAVSLRERSELKKILIFWSPDCLHCTSSIDKWKSLSSDYPDFEIITIAVYKDRNYWNNFIAENQMDFSITLIDTSGWQGDLVENYLISRTPTYMVLNEKNEIIAKPENLLKLKEFLLP